MSPLRVTMIKRQYLPYCVLSSTHTSMRTATILTSLETHMISPQFIPGISSPRPSLGLVIIGLSHRPHDSCGLGLVQLGLVAS